MTDFSSSISDIDAALKPPSGSSSNTTAPSVSSASPSPAPFSDALSDIDAGLSGKLPPPPPAPGTIPPSGWTTAAPQPRVPASQPPLGFTIAPDAQQPRPSVAPAPAPAQPPPPAQDQPRAAPMMPVFPLAQMPRPNPFSATSPAATGLPTPTAPNVPPAPSGLLAPNVPPPAAAPPKPMGLLVPGGASSLSPATPTSTVQPDQLNTRIDGLLGQINAERVPGGPMSSNPMPSGAYQPAPSPSATAATAPPNQGPGLLGNVINFAKTTGSDMLNAAKGVGEGAIDALTAGWQGTSPIVPGNYQLAPPEEQAKFQELGVPSDQTKYVALRDPGTGQYQVYLRSPDTNEGRLAGVGRMLEYGLPGEGIPMVATPRALTPSQQSLQDFRAAGVAPSIPTVGQGAPSQLTSKLVSYLPFAGGAVSSAVNRAASDTGQAVERLASNLGTATNAEDAGNSAIAGIRRAASDFKHKAADLYGSFQQSVNPNQQVDLTNTMSALRGPMDRFPSSPGLGEQLTDPKLANIYNSLQNSGGKLTFGELSELRSNIGKRLSDPGLIDDISRSDLKSVYAGITQDMGVSAAAAGPDATKAFNAATGFYRNGITQMDRLEGILNDAPEKVFAKINAAAGNASSADANLLRTLKSNLPQDQFNDIGAAIIRKMGQPSANAAVAAGHGDDFSVGNFVTSWNKLSSAAKDTLFGPQGVQGGTRDQLDTLVRVAGAQKFTIPSKSGLVSHGGEGTLGALLAAHVFENIGEYASHPEKLLAFAGAALGGHMMGKMLMSPTFARWLYTAPQMVKNSPTPLTSAVSRLGQLARVDPTLAPAYNQLMAVQSGAAGSQYSPPTQTPTPAYAPQ